MPSGTLWSTSNDTHQFISSWLFLSWPIRCPDLYRQLRSQCRLWQVIEWYGIHYLILIGSVLLVLIFIPLVFSLIVRPVVEAVVWRLVVVVRTLVRARSSTKSMLSSWSNEVRCILFWVLLCSRSHHPVDSKKEQKRRPNPSLTNSNLHIKAVWHVASVGYVSMHSISMLWYVSLMSDDWYIIYCWNPVLCTCICISHTRYLFTLYVYINCILKGREVDAQWWYLLQCLF